MDQDQYTYLTTKDMTLANDLAKILSTRVTFIFSGILTPANNEHFNDIQVSLEQRKAIMFERTELFYKMGKHAPGKN